MIALEEGCPRNSHRENRPAVTRPPPLDDLEHRAHASLSRPPPVPARWAGEPLDGVVDVVAVEEAERRHRLEYVADGLLEILSFVADHDHAVVLDLDVDPAALRVVAVTVDERRAGRAALGLKPLEQEDGATISGYVHDLRAACNNGNARACQAVQALREWFFRRSMNGWVMPDDPG